MTEEDILTNLRQGNDHKALVRLYEHLPKVENMVRHNGGSRADARDIFQDALIILHRNIRKEGYSLSCGLGTYLYSICRNRWMEELRRKGRSQQGSDALPDEPTDLQELLVKEHQYSLAERALRSLGDKCLDLLKRFYLLKEPLMNIARSIGLSGEGAAKTRKYKCLEEARRRYRSMLVEGNQNDLQSI